MNSNNGVVVEHAIEDTNVHHLLVRPVRLEVEQIGALTAIVAGPEALVNDSQSSEQVLGRGETSQEFAELPFTGICAKFDEAFQ